MKKAYEIFRSELDSIKEAGTYKDERIITTPQKARIDTTVAKGVLNMCANNYLGLSDSKELIEAAKASYDEWGFGLSSVRFICGTQLIHKQLERKIADFLGMDDCILYTSCFDANGGLFETLLGAEDAIISDELNHASIIDGVRLCKAKRFRYKNNNMEDLKAQLEAAKDCRIKVIATDGVFSMDGFIANLPAICDLADEYGALVMVDDSHAVGFMGEHGKGTHEHCGVMGRVDIITGTLGKALGGASGGYTAARQEVIGKLGFDVPESIHPIVPVMLYDAKVAQEFARRMLEKGVYVVGFCYPVVPMGKARIRTQVSAGHTKEDLDFAVKCFKEVKEEMGI